MTTVEKLLVQIFERKNSIIEQVRQQTELYNQHLASKLLIDGIAPPSWLWDANTSSNSKEQNKEDLISKLLCPHPQPSAHCNFADYSLYSNLVSTGENEAFSKKNSFENMALNRGYHRLDDAMAAEVSREDHAGFAIDFVPEPDASVTSPADQTDERILNIYNAVEESLSKIQRSRSRQKALELRNSAKSKAKNCKSHENISNSLSNQIRFSLSSTDPGGQKDEVAKWAESCAVGSQICNRLDGDKADLLNKEKKTELYSGRITRSRSHSQGLVTVRDSLTLSSDDHKDNASCHDTKVRERVSMPMSDFGRGDDNVDKLPTSDQPSSICCQSDGNGKWSAADCIYIDKESDSLTGRFTGSKTSCKCPSCACDPSRAGDDLPLDSVDGSLARVSSSDVHSEGCDAGEPISEDGESHRGRSIIPYLSSRKLTCEEDVSDLAIPCRSTKGDGGIPTPSSGGSLHLVNDSNELLGLVKPSVGLFSRVTRSQAHSKDQEKPESAYYNGNPSVGGTMSKSDCKRKSGNVDPQIVNRSPPLSKLCDTHGENEISRSLITSDAKARKQLESHIVPTPSGCYESVELLQPNSIEGEEPNFNTSASCSPKRRLSAEKMSCSLSNPTTLVEKGISGDVNQLSTGKQSMSKSSCKQKSANVELQIVNRSPPLHETHYVLGEHESGQSFIPSNTTERRKLESHIVPTPSGSFEAVEPLQPDFIENEDCNLKASASLSKKKRLANSAESMSCSLSEPAVYVEKGFSSDVNQLSMGKQFEGMLDVSPKLEEASGDSFQSDAQVNPSTRADRYGSAALISDYAMVRTSQDNTQDKLNYKISEAYQERYIMSSDKVDIRNIHHPSKLNVEHRLESLMEQHMAEGNESGEAIDKGELMSNSLVSENLGSSALQNSAKEPSADSGGSTIGDAQMKSSASVPEKIEIFSAHESKKFTCLDQHAGCHMYGSPPGENSLHGRRCMHPGMESWPQLKRRKIDRLLTHSSIASSIPRVRMPQSVLGSSANKYLEKMKICDVSTSADVETLQIMGSNMTEGTEPTFSSLKAEVAFCYKEKDADKNFSSVINSEQLEAALVPSMTKKARNSHGCFVERMSTLNSSSNDAGEVGDGQCSQPDKNPNDPSSKDLTISSTMLDEMQSPDWEGGSQIQPSVLSPSADDRNLVDVDQSMPVFEGFTVDAVADSGELEFEANSINFDKIELPRNAIERASILAEICKSASLNTPLSQFSSTFELQGTQNIFQSVADDQCGRLNMHGTPSLSCDVEKQLQSRSFLANDYKDAFGEMPYSDFQAYSGVQYDWDSRNNYGSPVGKPWGELSSHTGSVGKSSSSNPELVCFPIEEDPCTSEENTSSDERADDVLENIDPSSVNHCDRRQPFKDLTNLDLDPQISIPAHDEMLREDCADFMSKKLSVTRAQDKVQLSTREQSRAGSETMEKEMSYVGSTNGWNSQTLSVGPKEIRKTKESINNSISKPIQSNKASLRRQDQKLSLKESRRNNIVSNVSSFIPIVQQKKAAAVCTGKRDVKVKALEAAEAAKRLEEKRENERKMRKEALKVERAKLEEKNLRNIELEKRKKEEERKKRDADNMAKKRIREEEAKKEKEKKRMKLETKQRQREQEEKLRAEKGGKEKQESKDVQMNKKKEFHNESKKQLNAETSKGDGTSLEKTETKWTSTNVVMNCEGCGASGQSCKAEKAMQSVDKSPKKEDLIVQSSQGRSYEISPYQCSDDEDEEEDELPTKKYIPPWASKNSVALLLPLQKDMDPDVVFPPESFCSIDEVLLPRKLQQKQVAA